MRSHLLFGSSLLLVQTASAAFGVCYRPSGVDVQSTTSDHYFRCSSSATDVSMCCNESDGDKCSPEGLCSKKGDPEDKFWRVGCSDQTWQSDECLKLCISGNTSKYLPMLDTFKCVCDADRYCQQRTRPQGSRLIWQTTILRF